MMKKIFLVIIMFMLFMGVVNASSINGDYNGNPVVIVKSDGKQLQSDEVPAMIYNGHTVVPISLLRQLGAAVQWNESDYSVNVTLPKIQPQIMANLSLNDIAKEAVKHNVILVTNAAVGDENGSIITFFYKNELIGTGPSNDDFLYILQACGKTDAFRCRISDIKQQVFYVDIKYLKDFYSNKISPTELKSHYAYENTQSQAESPTNNTNNSTTTNSRNSNNSTVENGENGSFQFIGLNDFYDKIGNLHIAGQVKNKSGRTSSMFIKITATLFDKDGGVVGTQDAPTHYGSLEDGESYSFDIMFYNSPKNSVRYEIHVKG